MIKKDNIYINILFSMFAFVFIIGLLSNIYSLARGSSGNFTFQYFLDLIESYVPIAPSFALNSFSITADWGIFDFFRSSIEFIGNFFTLIGFLAIHMLNAIKFILHFFVGLFTI